MSILILFNLYTRRRDHHIENINMFTGICDLVPISDRVIDQKFENF